MKKYSFVGIALLAATAITAAFVPSNARTPAKVALNGTLILSDVTADWTCTVGAGGQCSYTVTGVASATGVATATDNSTHAGSPRNFGTTEG